VLAVAVHEHDQRTALLLCAAGSPVVGMKDGPVAGLKPAIEPSDRVGSLGLRFVFEGD
jgi:hypothetical protein